jgi:hypothetical protein
MEIRLGWAIVAGIALGGAVAWWELGHPGWETMDQKVAAADKTEAAGKKAKSSAEPALYRWHDADGVLQITDHPPKGRKYEKVKIREDQNIIPMSSVINPPSKQAPKKAGAG